MIIDFLATKRSKEDLKTALEVLYEFKDCESEEEYLAAPFCTWAKLEQLEEYLAFLVEGAALKPDTLQEMQKPGVKHA